MYQETSPEILKRKFDNNSSNNLYDKPKIDTRVSTPTISTSYWRLKNEGDTNFDAKTGPVQKKKVDLIVNAYSRDYLRGQEYDKYYKELKNQYMEQERRKNQLNQNIRQMDEKDIQNKV